MGDTGAIIIFITASSDEEAGNIAKTLVTEQLAACVNIIDNVRSIFRWQGDVEDADEFLLVVKTRAELLDNLTVLVKQEHSYDLPEIIALLIVGGSKEYLNWIDSETTV